MNRYSEEKAVQRYMDERDYWASIIEGLELIEEPKGLDILNISVAELTRDYYGGIVDCVNNKRPFIGAYYTSAPEIFAAMDLPYLMPLATPFLSTSAPYITDDVDAAERSGLASDFCTAIRLGIYCVEASLMPTPSAMVSLLYPCDGAGMLQQVISHNEDWSKVPTYGIDPPYHSDERSVDYFAEQIRGMVPFLENHTGQKMDLDRLKEVIDESNKQYELWMEYNELRRAKPCPHNWEIGGQQCFGVAQCFQTGDPEGTKWFEMLLDNAEKRISEGRAGIPNEKIRTLWFDVFPM